jgi:Protein of unknown function (DUF1116)
MDLFRKPLRPVNVGLESFYQSMLAQGVHAISVDWRPPFDGYVDLPHTHDGIDVNAANAEALRHICAGRPLLTGMGAARDLIPGFAPSGQARLLITHSGPPITWDRMCGPMRGAIIGALIYEELAGTPDAAERIAASGEIEFAPCHHYAAVGPMAGIISPSMPVFAVRNETSGHIAYATQNEGLGRVLRYGAFGPEVIRRLKWMEKTLYPALRGALEASGPLDLRAMIAQALHMGDECHNRNKAGTSLFLRAIAPALVETAPDRDTAAAVLRFIDGNDHFFLNLAMAAMKAMLLPAEGLPGCTIVTTMARNGTDWGIRVSATGGRWYTAPAPNVQGLWLPGYTAADANPDIGDSAITETGGIGGFALAGAPAIVKFVGGTPADALTVTAEMYEITAGEHTAFSIPALDFRGTPVGVDVRKVMRTGILPRLNTGIAHREPGLGMVGAGLVQAPAGCFQAAFEALRTL